MAVVIKPIKETHTHIHITMRMQNYVTKFRLGNQARPFCEMMFLFWSKG